METVHRRRRSHRKSRLGCFACKARKTKCSEAVPACNLCLWHGTRCVYPQAKANNKHNETLSCRQLMPAPATNTTLEQRYFHHFLTVAYPFLPVGNEQVWITQVPRLATQNADVMSAMLGLSAAHLACLTTSQPHLTRAIVYRGRSLAALNTALSNTEWTHSEVDSALALVFLLTSQSQYMDDGLFDFMTMIGGSVLLSKYFVRSGYETSFNLVTITDGPSVPESAVGGLPSLDLCCMGKGLAALNLLCPLLQTDEQIQLFLSIQAVFQASLDSTRHAFEEFWNALDNSIPSSVANSDVIVKALHAFLIALRLFMNPITEHVFRPREMPYNTIQEVRSVTINWGLRIFQSLPPHVRKYVEWPEAVVENALLHSKTVTSNQDVAPLL